MEKAELVKVTQDLVEGKSFIKIKSKIWAHARTIVLFLGYCPTNNILSLKLSIYPEGTFSEVSLSGQDIEGLTEVTPEEILTFLTKIKSFLI